MKGQGRVPPRLSSGGAGERSRCWWLAVPMFVVLGFWLLRWGVAAGLPLPGCGFRAATGLPCPGCGSTRALLALSGADVSLAWRFNPLATVLLLGTAVAVALWFAGCVLGLGSVARIVRRSGAARWVERGGPLRRWAWVFLAVATLLNWWYLLGQGGSP